MSKRPHTERYRLFARFCRANGQKPSTVGYAEWIAAGGHAFRKAEELSPVAPIGRSPKFTAFLKQWGWFGIPF